MSEDILSDAKKFTQDCEAADNENHVNARDDLRFLLGGENQWRPEDLYLRRIDSRPWMTVNKLPTFIHQVTNSLRQNRPSIKIHPVGGDADYDTAQVRQGLIRHIEYDSNADVAYDRAVCSAACIGFGYLRVFTDYSDPMSFNQDIKIGSIRNPFTVRFDPFSVEPDGSDAKKAIVAYRINKEEFKKQYPDAEACNVTSISNDLTAWFIGDDVVVADFYRIEEELQTLCLMPDGSTVWKDKLSSPMVPIKERKSMRRKVMLYKITGCDVLESTEVMSYWIPVFPVYGDEIDIDGKAYRSGLIRNAKDPARMYNYWMTSATEEVALRPKSPYIGAVGQFEDLEQDWANANRRSFPYLQYRPVTIDGNLAPAPQRQQMADIPSGMLQMAMHANDNIKATTGLFDASLGARGNATSGKQEIAQQRQGDIANFHYVDGLSRTIRHVGRVINYMIPHYYDTERAVKIMRIDDTVSHETINQVIQDPLTGAIVKVMNDMTGGEYDVTVAAGAPYSTLRAEAADNMTELASRDPGFLQIAGDLYFKELDWPGADKIAARYKKIIDPKLTEDEDADGVEAKAAKLAQMEQMLTQQAQEMEMRQAGLMEQEASASEEMSKLKEEYAKVQAAKAELGAQQQIFRAQISEAKAQLRVDELTATLAVQSLVADEPKEEKEDREEPQMPQAPQYIPVPMPISKKVFQVQTNPDGSMTGMIDNVSED